MEALIKELNSRLAVHLDTSISFDRNPAAPAWKPGRYIMVGASHASRTADALAASGQTVTKLTQPGWRITRPKVADMASKLHQLLKKEGADYTVVFEMLDSNFFLAKTEEGGMVPICWRGSRVYHVDGDLVFAPKELQYSVFRDAIPLLEVAGGRKTIILSPIPRYLVLGCCPDPDHAGNRSSQNFRCGLESAVISAERTSRITASCMGSETSA